MLGNSGLWIRIIVVGLHFDKSFRDHLLSKSVEIFIEFSYLLFVSYFVIFASFGLILLFAYFVIGHFFLRLGLRFFSLTFNLFKLLVECLWVRLRWYVLKKFPVIKHVVSVLFTICRMYNEVVSLVLFM